MRKKVQTTYRKAASSPSTRQRRSQRPAEAVSESHLSPLARYIAENEDSGISVSELTEQFREIDCEHKNVRISANSPSARFLTCDACGKTTKEIKDVK